uniref:Uncharacterized protein n=1 Tax=Alexandrium monilatum TaxID=311494 RepID=A0A7S4Q8B7_9DINO
MAWILIARWAALILSGLAAAERHGEVLTPGSRVVLDLFIASKCPDAARCENSFLPRVLAEVGELVDLRLGFIAEPNASAPTGLSCMHGEGECLGNAVQLCVQRHFPGNLDLDSFAGQGLTPAHVWTLFLQCVGRFNHTADSQIPGNTVDCLQQIGVPLANIDVIRRCARGPEGRQLSAESARRAWSSCGHHSPVPGRGCRSCSMLLEGRLACIVDGGELRNCTGLGSDPEAWVDRICGLARAKAAAGSLGVPLPLRCRVPRGYSSSIWGHAFFSADPGAAAAFAEAYFGARRLRDVRPGCGSAREVEVALPALGDVRGGGLHLKFVNNPGKPGGPYGVADFVRSMGVLFGNLSDNGGRHWNQFFDAHLGFYVPSMVDLAAALLRDGVPFFTTLSSGVYQSLYVAIPGTGHVVEVLGDFLPAAPLPPSHVRVASTQQFCTPKRRLGDALGGGLDPGSADVNKTTMAGADPDAAVDFAVRYLGGARVQQARGPPADGQCAKLAWAQWPDKHQWHVVDAKAADWVTIDHLRPAVPFNISQLASYIEGLRDLRGNRYDQWLDFRDIFEVSDLLAVAEVLRTDGVPFGVWSRPKEGECSLYVSIPGNGIAVELRAPEATAGLGWLRERCRGSVFDLCDQGDGQRRIHV